MTLSSGLTFSTGVGTISVGMAIFSATSWLITASLTVAAQTCLCHVRGICHGCRVHDPCMVDYHVRWRGPPFSLVVPSFVTTRQFGLRLRLLEGFLQQGVVELRVVVKAEEGGYHLCSPAFVLQFVEQWRWHYGTLVHQQLHRWLVAPDVLP